MIYGEYYDINVWICGQFGLCPRIHLNSFCRRASKILRYITIAQGTLSPVAIPSSQMT